LYTVVAGLRMPKEATSSPAVGTRVVLVRAMKIP
jgi:hypothetical protein